VEFDAFNKLLCLIGRRSHFEFDGKLIFTIPWHPRCQNAQMYKISTQSATSEFSGAIFYRLFLNSDMSGRPASNLGRR